MEADTVTKELQELPLSHTHNHTHTHSHTYICNTPYRLGIFGSTPYRGLSTLPAPLPASFPAYFPASLPAFFPACLPASLPASFPASPPACPPLFVVVSVLVGRFSCLLGAAFQLQTPLPLPLHLAGSSFPPDIGPCLC